MSIHRLLTNLAMIEPFSVDECQTYRQRNVHSCSAIKSESSPITSLKETT